MYAIRRITIDIAIDTYEDDKAKFIDLLDRSSVMEWMDIHMNDGSRVLGYEEGPFVIVDIPKPEAIETVGENQ
jgi:hypothetical protein